MRAVHVALVRAVHAANFVQLDARTLVGKGTFGFAILDQCALEAAPIIAPDIRPGMGGPRRAEICGL